MASALFAAQMHHHTESVSVSSAGIRAGRGLTPDAVPDEVLEVMDTYGIDLRDHRSRALTATMLQEADLVIGMGRRHVQEAVLLDSESWPHAFMLKELVRRGELIGARPPAQPVESWIATVHGDRTRGSLAHRSGADEVADPYGKTLADYRSTAAELDRLTAQLTALLWPTLARRPAGPS
jgi:protein-tyrosine phosphatase